MHGNARPHHPHSVTEKRPNLLPNLLHSHGVPLIATSGDLQVILQQIAPTPRRGPPMVEEAHVSSGSSGKGCALAV